jgi:hypothetical protein
MANIDDEKTYVVLFNETPQSYEKQIKLGLNIPRVFNEDQNTQLGECILYSYEEVPHGLHNKTLIGYVMFCPDTIKVPLFIGIKVNKFIVVHCENIGKFSRWREPEFCANAASINGRCIKYVPRQTHDLCIVAIKSTPEAIKFIKNPTQEMYELAVQKLPATIQYMPEEYRTEEICTEAIKKDPLVVQHLEFDEELFLLAIRGNPESIKYMKDITKEFCLNAIEVNVLCCYHIPYESIDIDICMSVWQKDAYYLCVMLSRHPRYIDLLIYMIIATRDRRIFDYLVNYLRNRSKIEEVRLFMGW